MTKVELRINYDGDVPGLASHELSLGAFGAPLERLLAAYRRTATSILTDVVGNGGRYARRAEALDLRISRIVDGSTGVVFSCAFAPRGDELPGVLDDWDLAERSNSRLLDALRRESSGSPASPAVAGYLASLPPGLTKQTYENVVDGVVRESVTFGGVSAAPELRTVPALRNGVGVIVGVTFDTPGVKVRLDEGGTVSLPATAAQVDDAIALRGNTAVFVRYVEIGSTKRLLVLRAQDALRRMNEEERTTHIFERWGEVLRRLGK